MLDLKEDPLLAAGPTQFIVDIVRSAKGLADIFFAIIPLAFFERVA